MSTAMLEHVNITVSDPQKTAALMCALFDWEIRWQGEAKLGGYTVHVGAEDNYVAVYAHAPLHAPAQKEQHVPEVLTYDTRGGLNHIGVVVEDIEAAEQRVLDRGFKPHNHGDYEPGRRFYFLDDDGIEFEIISYS